MSKISIDREGGTDWLYPGLFEKEISKHDFCKDIMICFEPKLCTSEVYFCQDYPLALDQKYFELEAYRKPDVIFVALPSHLKSYKESGFDRCYLVTYAADKEIHKPVDTKKIYDVGFVGNPYYKSRVDYLKTIEKFYPRSFANFNTLPSDQIPKVLSQCKVLFNHTREVIDVNLRFFEAMALGCQVMIRNEWLDQFATDGVHYMGYSSEGECIEVIKRLLEDDDLREKITHNAREHFLANHTYTHRAKTIINHLTEYLEGK